MCYRNVYNREVQAKAEAIFPANKYLEVYDHKSQAHRD